LVANRPLQGFASVRFRAKLKPTDFSEGLGRLEVLRILIVEDDSQLATTLKYLVEDNPRYRVVGLADDADSAIARAESDDPDIALVDLHLARGSTGFSVAVRLAEMEIPVLFVSGKAPSFPMPDLALGCLMKPFTAEDVHRSLGMAEDILRGRETLRPKIPENLTLYEQAEEPSREQAHVEHNGFIPSRPSFKTRLEHWISSHHA
jgi:DNA-binding NarL/FixJ family response regulator